MTSDESRLDDTIEVARLSGAVFTTVANGARVDANIYSAKTDVYLDGGPGPGAPAKAACLPAGPYYFQVTEPSGNTLLSTDAIGCRRFLVTAACTIDYAPLDCAAPHVTGTDVDHGGDTIQLMRYLDTPNHGGEYKMWVTSQDSYDEREGTFGFINSDAKTDNYKIRALALEPPPPPCCGDGHVDAGETCDDGNTASGDGCSATCQIEPPPAPVCGNGVVEAGEQCDDGDTIDDNACTNSCVPCPIQH